MTHGRVRRANRVNISLPPVGNEADLAMKEEQTMSKRRSANRRFTLTLTVVAVLGIMMCVSLPEGLAGEGESIVEKVRDAKTPADHQAIAAFFEKEAQAAQQEATLHGQLQDTYAERPEMAMMVSHCEMLVKHYQEIAKELKTMAEMHEKMAGMGR
jgi:hypothetical protein